MKLFLLTVFMVLDIVQSVDRGVSWSKPARMVRLFLALFFVFLASCTRDGAGGFLVMEPDEIYKVAISQYQRGNLDEATGKLHELQRLYPFTKLAEKAHVLDMYFNFLAGYYDYAFTSADRYISDHSGGEYLEYAYYVRGMSAYSKVVDVNRNSRLIVDASVALNDFLSRYPEGKYSDDVRKKVAFLHSKKALMEMKTGGFYLSSANYIAAVHRFSVVVRDFWDTKYVPEALFRLYEAYSALGIKYAAHKYSRALLNRFPSSVWASRLREK